MVNQKALDFLRKTNLNVIDIKILISCFETPLSISEIQGIVGIAYKNLSPHIKKLKKLGLILEKDHGIGKKKEIITNYKDRGVNYFMFGLISLWTPQEILNKNNKLYEEICNFLKENSKK